MALQSSGAISLGNVNTELGRSATATISLGETAVRTLAGVSSGAISLASLYGKSNGPSFIPDGGASGAPVLVQSESYHPNAALATLTCSAPAVWTWTRVGTVGAASVINGSSATSIQFSLVSSPTVNRTVTFNVSATSGGVTKYWTVKLYTFTHV